MEEVFEFCSVTKVSSIATHRVDIGFITVPLSSSKKEDFKLSNWPAILFVYVMVDMGINLVQHLHIIKKVWFILS